MSARPSFFVSETESPLGTLTIVTTERGICHLHFGPINEASLNAKLKKMGLKPDWTYCTERTSLACKQLHEYFNGTRSQFDIDIDLHGSPFQKKVWEALRQIEYGETRSYKEIAQEIGAPKAVRAVGGANNRNPIPIIIPCHRVIGSNGAMVGYGGGVKKKELLLNLEGCKQIS
ncbi:methylated-DNA--[protein]-cysteine S-methyltransferase [Shouchella shacheensis]|uniref:methylated-DNA--[protein]-cysteine S-methyltransferase n=1 Tax=Shouchella shacheensis TaxID=1649580 RepID=UPI0007403BC5|nr:methylated-DNA--[protein]-cysteine S-methyltransferase [Shouchella shacheensis]